MEENNRSTAKRVAKGVAIVAAALLAVKGCEMGYTYFKGRQDKAALEREEQRLQLSQEFLRMTEASKASDVKEEYTEAFKQIRGSAKEVKGYIKASQLRADADKSIEQYIDDKDLDDLKPKYEALSKKFMDDKTAYIKKIGEYSSKVGAFNAQVDKDCGQEKDCTNVLDEYLKDDAKTASIKEASEAYAQMMGNVAKDCDNDNRYLSTVISAIKSLKTDDRRKDVLEMSLSNFNEAAKDRAQMARKESEEMQKRVEYMSSEKMAAK